MSVFSAAKNQPEPPTAAGSPPPPLYFKPGMSGNELLSIIFRVCKEQGVSDIQMRTDRPVYIHTNRGVEKLEHLGPLSSAHLDEILKELIRNRESASHGFGQSNDVSVRVEDKIEAVKLTEPSRDTT